MFTNKTPGVVVAEIEMLRAANKITGFIVEGHDDSRFWRARTAPKRVTIIDCEGKENLIEVARHASEAGKDYVVGIYDADFDNLSGIRHYADLLAITDENDLEITLLRSPCLNRLLDHLAEPEKVISFEQSINATVADHIESIARKFGELRFINHRNRLGVNFEFLSPYRFVRAADWSLNLNELHEQFLQLSGLAKEDLDIHLAGLQRYGKWILVQGHDCVKILTQGMKNVLAKRQSTEADITRMLALAFDDAQLAATRMYAELTQMERRLGIQLLKE
ncbi:DUF4435 domain-containing protein [Variovorax sp. NFACC27]|uniref:DUF4435 domain-containing protein n=1 Tax=unclassified Variovorax TaxID=663243 RepID=UPI00089A76CC|nr:Protein of unknown function [Variovorax sp. NFACC28]SEG25962.1 Protein of unknown function [Variovorax sp. NFACC29]SFC46376.1 Protein of unknown function [Variovorax sp. NFACC26]SFF92176.1 Protein of unknown function [Variovorax sp. NFACC27]